MFYVLKDDKTGSYYMKPDEFKFYAYSDDSRDSVRLTNTPDVRCTPINIKSKKELATVFFSAGFLRGYLDDKMMLLNNKDSYHCKQNPNEIAYAQYLLTGNTDYIENLIKKEELITICKVKGEEVFFPTIEYEGERVVFTYTDLSRVPTQLFDKYPNYTPVKMTFKCKCLINDKFISD